MPKQDLTNLQKVNGTFYVNYSINGTRIRKSLKTKNYKEARAKADKILLANKTMIEYEDVIRETARAKKLFTSTEIMIVDTWKSFESYLKRIDTTEDTLKRYKSKWNRLLGWLKTNYSNIDALSQITPEIAIRYADNLNESRIGNKVYNETLNNLGRIYSHHLQDLSTDVNPFEPKYIERKNKHVDTVPKEELTGEQVYTILQSIPTLKLKDISELEMLFNIGIYTGMRLEDCCKLKWADIRDDFIYVTPQKTKKHNTRVQIPVVPEFKEKLDAFTKNDESYILPNLAFRYDNHRNSVHKAVMRIFNHNNYVNVKENEDRLYASAKYGFHSLRYGFVYICALNEIPLAMVQEIVGHTNIAMTRYYTRYSMQMKQDALKNFTIVPLPVEDLPDFTDIAKSLRDELSEMLCDELENMNDKQFMQLLLATEKIYPEFANDNMNYVEAKKLILKGI
jgi:integrase